MHVLSSAILCGSLFLIAACNSGGGGGGVPSATHGSVIGRVTIDGASGATTGGDAFGLRVEREHNAAGRNEDLFAAEDLGDVGAADVVVHGSTGRGPDARDCLRAAVRGSGALRIHVRLGANRGTVAVFRLPGGRAPAEAVALAENKGGADLGAFARDGDHLVVVIEAATPTDYTLAVTRTGTGPGAATLPQEARAAAARLLTRPHTPAVPGELLVGFAGDDAESAQRRIEQLGFELAGSGGGVHRFRATRGTALRTDDHGAAALADAMFTLRRELQGLAFVTPNHRVETAKEPNDELYWRHRWPSLWTGLPQAWDVTTGERIVIAVIDSGILASHPDLAAAVSPHGFDMVSDPHNGDGDGIDADPEDVLLEGNLFHGSHVAGIIGATADNEIGIAGVNWKAEILPVRALGPQTGTLFDIVQAIKYAVGLPNASGRVPPQPARIVNMSLITRVDNPGMHQAVREAVATGAILVAAAGNSARDGNPVFYPAAYDEVIAVGSVGPRGQRAGYSEIQSYVDIVAPGGDMSARSEDGVISTVAFEEQGQWRYGWSFLEGTSMATPFVAGAISLMLSVDPDLTTADVRRIFAATALDRGARGKDDEYGWGLIDVKAAVDAAGNGGGTQPELRADRQSLAFSSSGRQSIALTSDGAAITDLRVLTTDLPRWLTLELGDIVTPTVLAVTIDPAAFAESPQTVRFTVGSSSTPSIVEIEATIENGSIGDDLAVQLLGDDGAVLREVGATAGGFTIDDVPPGTYRLRAGLDMDGNGSLEDAGDFLSPPLSVTVEASVATDVGTIRASRR